MDIFLLIIAILCLIVGFIGSVAPALPGPPVSWVGLLLAKFTHFGAGIAWNWIIGFAVVVFIVSVLDYIVPICGTRKFGGTRAGTLGSTVGLIVGIFFSPWGIIAGPFLGAFIAELLAGSSGRHSLKAALGAFVGFLCGVGLKLIVCAWIAVYFVMQLF
jgi:uncharacterized protein YqgC (DUF456 family)